MKDFRGKAARWKQELEDLREKRRRAEAYRRDAQAKEREDKERLVKVQLCK